MKAVIYTDGGAQPNPGLSGWGAHGYFYDDDKPKKLIKENITGKGYIDGGIEESVNVLKFFNYLGTNGINTNNVSEINALYYSLEELTKYDITHIHILVDSEYIRKGILEWSHKWIRNNWKREDGNPVSNQEEWKRLLNILDEYRERKVTYDLEWVKGHNGNIGNTIADRLCNIAINILKTSKESVSLYKYYSPEDYWNDKVERNPYLSFKRVFFNSITEPKDIGYYFLEDSDKKDDKFYLGKKYNNCSFSVIKLNKPDHAIEVIKQKQSKIAEDYNVVVLLKLDRLYEPDLYRYLKDYGEYALYRANNYSVNMNFLDNKPVTKEIDPPGLSLYAMETFGYMESILKSLIDQKDFPLLHRVDITNLIFIEQPKGKKVTTVLNPTLKPNLKILDVNLNLPDLLLDNKKISLVLGSDILNRNNLKKIETLHPHVEILLIKNSESSYTYMTYIKSDIGEGIWSSIYSNTIYF